MTRRPSDGQVGRTTLVFGAGGMVGRAVVAVGRRRGETVEALDRAAADITVASAVRRAVAATSPSVIVNCAALTAVDECETRPEEAMEVNGRAVGSLLAAARESGSRLVQVSTDFVFDGDRDTAYPEEAGTAPLSAYGLSKLEGEKRALAEASSLVVRTSWLFGPGGANFVATMARFLGEGKKPLRVVADQVGCPTYVPYLAEAIWELIGLRSSGIVHYRNRDPVSWHGFAVAIAERLGDTDEVVAISSEELARPAPRPRYSVLDVSRFESLTGRAVEAWEPGLDEYLNWIRDQETP